MVLFPELQQLVFLRNKIRVGSDFLKRHDDLHLVKKILPSTFRDES
jgi:hypothetical protein